VKDYAMDQPLVLRLVGLDNLTLVTSAASTSTVAMRAIANVEYVREKLRTAVQTERDCKRVREMDVDSHDGGVGIAGCLAFVSCYQGPEPSSEDTEISHRNNLDSRRENPSAQTSAAFQSLRCKSSDSVIGRQVKSRPSSRGWREPFSSASTA
jgi:hypothetical protein